MVLLKFNEKFNGFLSLGFNKPNSGLEQSNETNQLWKLATNGRRPQNLFIPKLMV